MARTIRLEDRELLTIADMVREALEDRDSQMGTYQQRSLVRLALVIDQLGRPRTHRLMVLAAAPAWVNAYLARPIIDLAPPARRAPAHKPHPPRKQVRPGLGVTKKDRGAV